MKNLKRVLSLGLASVMLMGMMVMGASAKDFTDAADIEHAEAVDILVALSVVNGKEDGSHFDPKGDVTRAEMAKMIAVLMNGGSEANTGVKSTPSFTDIGGHWAEGWIEYCADMKIINGRGDGSFDPNGNVTGVEALKMVLTALGYDAEAYHLVGASWAAQTLERARNTGNVKLIEGLDSVVMTAPATRDTAAQMIWNGLQAYVVTTTPDQNTNNGEVTWNYKTTTTPLLKQRYDANVVTGTYAGNHNYNGGGALKGEIVVTVKDKNDPTYNGTHTFPSDLSIDNIGEEVKIVWKDNTRGTKNQADNKDTIYGCFNTGATRVVRSQLSKIKDAKDNKVEINIDGVKYECTDIANKDEDDVLLVTNFVGTGTATSAKSVGNDNSALTKALKKNSGNPIKVVFDDNGKVNKIYLTETYVAAVTAINSTNITLNNGVGILKIEDHDIEEDLKKGDIVTVTPLYSLTYSDSDCVATVKKAEVVSGELTAFKDQENVVVGGKTYKLNYKNDSAKKHGLLQNHPDADVKIIGDFAAKSNDNNYIGEDVELYLSNGYVVAAVQVSESASNYSVITEVKTGVSTGSVFSGLQLQVMGADGTKEIITVSEDSDDTKTREPNENGITSADYGVGDIITYSFNDDDEAEVTVQAQAAKGNLSYSNKTKTVNSAVAAADCVLFAQTKNGITMTANQKIFSGSEYEAYDIRELDTATWTDKLFAVAKDKNGKVVAVFVNANNVPDGATDNTVYGVISAYDGRVKDYYKYTVQANGETYTVNSKSTLGTQKGVLVKFRPTADDNYGSGKVEKITGRTDDYFVGYVKEFSNRDNTLTYFTATEKQADGSYVGKGTALTYALDKDAKIIYVDQDNQKSEAEASVDEFNAINNKPNVAFITKVVDNVTVIDVLFVETSGKKHVNFRNQ